MSGFVVIPIARGAAEVLVDAADAAWAQGHTWYLSDGGYAKTNLPRATYGRRPSIAMHRLLLGVGPTDIVDHINRDKLDNRRSNLRITDRVANTWNVGLRSNNRSGYKGVSWDAKSKRWYASIRVSKRSISLGLHATPELAAAAYDAAAREFFGEFAYLNGVAS